MNALDTEIENLKRELKYLTERCATDDENKLFSLSQFCEDDQILHWISYCGVFDALYQFCNSGEHKENITY